MADRTAREGQLTAMFVVIHVVGALAASAAFGAQADLIAPRETGGGITLEFDPAFLREAQWQLSVRRLDGDALHVTRITFEAVANSRLELDETSNRGDGPAYGEVFTTGALLFETPSQSVVIGQLGLVGAAGRWVVTNGLSTSEEDEIAFELGSLFYERTQGETGVRLVGELLLSEWLADRLGMGQLHDEVIGRIIVSTRARMIGEVLQEEDQSIRNGSRDSQSPVTAQAIGPDVIVGNLQDLSNYGHSGGISAFSVGTISCNVGDAELLWIANTNQHPVIAQNMFRLKNNRFEQIGMSWLKHGFFALSQNTCFIDCQPTDGSRLGIHCSDPYSAALNGSQGGLGPRWQVNAFTGAFPYPPANPSYSGILARRLQVRNSDLDPAINGGGQYFVEGHYVTPDDAAAGNQYNNASYRPVSVSWNGSKWTLAFTSSIRREKAAIRAWRTADPLVTETDVQVPDDGLFVVAAKDIELGGGMWRYEYAVANINSHRAMQAFSIPVDPQSTITNIGFHDVDYHSGEPFSGTDWTANVSAGQIRWSTQDFGVNPNANALRWSTLYNFRFDTNRPPTQAFATLTLFRPGTPNGVSASTVGPIPNVVDCNENGVPDILDVQYGTSRDCDEDGVLDECELPRMGAYKLAEGLSGPTFAAAPLGDGQRLFIVEQAGRIRILKFTIFVPTPFLDISNLISSPGTQGTGGGLLGLAFHPAYASNGFFYVTYTNLAGDLVLARYRASTNPDVADSGSALILKTIEQDEANRPGGALAFGPDGFLYMGTGDGGASQDFFNRAQDPASLLGKILRLDVNAPSPYIPASNPFAGPGLPLDEIWALGVRNPRAISFDSETGDLYVADSGGMFAEEINVQPAVAGGGRNYGWRCMEGSGCTGLSGCTCNALSLTTPTHEYSHENGDCRVIGGYVYRGCALPHLRGQFLYADFCSGKIRSFRLDNGAATDHQDLTSDLTPTSGPIGSIVTFAQNGLGEVFILNNAGNVYQIVFDPAGGGECGNGTPEPGEYCDDGNTVPGDGCDELCRIETGPPNDRCAYATRIGDGSYSVDTTGGSTDGPDESAICQTDPGDSVEQDAWFCYTASQSGTATVNLCGSTIDTMVAAYQGCQCPTGPSALTCDEDDGCTDGSSISFPAAACSSYLIRVGGFLSAEGLLEVDVSLSPDPIVNDCDGNLIDDADDILCGTHHDSNGNGVPDTCETSGDPNRGGRLYDSWWTEAALPEPLGDHPLWQFRPDSTSNTATGAATWRCKECHGWDYKGVNGQYGFGSHRTGFAGILGTTLDAADIFSLLKESPDDGQGSGIANGHDYGSVLPDPRINDLVAFVLSGTIDDDPFINAGNGGFLGNPDAGQANYESGIDPSCITCHGIDGAAINFGTMDHPVFLGTIARGNPWEMLHKIRFGQPAAPMPSWLGEGGETQGAADIGRYAQETFPECFSNPDCDDGIVCTSDSCDSNGLCIHAPQSALCPDDGVFCNGEELCDPAQGCVSAGNPCGEPSLCEEIERNCGCLPPQVTAMGSRYVAITPMPSNGTMPVAISITYPCNGGFNRYLGAPFGEFNVSLPVEDSADAAFLTPAQWGGTVHLTGIDLAPETTYSVRVDCGLPLRPVLTQAVETTTPVWGDVTGRPGGSEGMGPDGRADVLDIAAVVDGVKEAPGALPIYTLDLFGCVPNQRVNVIDVAGAVDAVMGVSFLSGPLCPGPCW